MTVPEPPPAPTSESSGAEASWEDRSAADAGETPPAAPRRPALIEAHGDRRVDDWSWLRDRGDPDVRAVLEAENAYTAAQTAHLTELRDELYAEFKRRIVQTDVSVPARKGPWWYYARTVEGEDYAIHCRIPLQGEGRDPSTPPRPVPGPGSRSAGEELWPDEQVLLDENALAESHAYLDVTNVSISPGHHLLSYALDTQGDERFTLRVRNLRSGEDLDERVEGTSYGLAWANDDATLFYTRPDSTNRPYQVWRHRVGDLAPDVCVYEESDERFHVGIGRTKDDAYILIELHSRVTSEVRVIAADEPAAAPVVVAPRRQDVEYTVEHHNGSFVMLTNDRAENFRLLAASTAALGHAAGHGTWREIVAHRADVRVEGFEVFSGHLVVYERRLGQPQIRIVALPEDLGRGNRPLSQGHVVPRPETPSACWGGGNLEFTSAVLRYEYSSLVTPRSVYDLDMHTGQTVLRKRQPVLDGYDPSSYATERLWATAPDGTAVPMSVVYRRDRVRTVPGPCLLYGYGAYEYSVDPVFSALRVSLLDRGFLFAIAHVRGGGEMGRRWYEEGKLLLKPNSFSDFVACARRLVADGWTSPEQLVARGGSAGGLLVGAVANSAPLLFRAIVADVPFVDCLTTMLDPTLPLTAIEWEEWGNPIVDPAVYAVMKSYSPYDNVRADKYPELFVTAGLEDPRVGYWEPAKWVQKLRAAHEDNRILLKVELDAGHAGPSGRYEAWRDEALVLAFVLDAVRQSRPVRPGR